MERNYIPLFINKVPTAAQLAKAPPGAASIKKKSGANVDFLYQHPRHFSICAKRLGASIPSESYCNRVAYGIV